MKRLTIKTRLVLLHTGLMILVVFGMLAVLFSVSSHEVLANVENALEQRVAEAFDEIEAEQGSLQFDKDLMELEHGVYLSVYDAGTESLLYGKIPYGFSYQTPFEIGRVRTITAETADYSVLDQEFDIAGYGKVLVRGIVSVSDAERDFRFTLSLALILSPILLVLTAVCGYLLSRWALRPVSQITKTVQQIQSRQDLSGRIQLGEGRDEIYTLAQTFDGLLETVEAGVKREKQFASDVAHELRTPISVVLMQCEDLLEQGHLTPQDQAAVEMMHRKLQTMAQMVSQLLLLSRADQGRQKLQLEQVDLSELSSLVAEEFGEIAGQKGLQLHARIEPDLVVTADQTLLIRLWDNLLKNAVAFTPDGGEITMALWAEGQEVCLQVQDTGIGIAPEHLPRIWDRFYQADPARSSDSSGLGLAMVQWIVQAHHGKITVQSQPGQGTVFTCRLPRVQPQVKSGMTGDRTAG